MRFNKIFPKKNIDSGNLAFLISKRGFLIRISAVTISALLVSLSIPPVGLGFLAFFALVPLFLAIYDRRPVVAAGYTFVYGCVWGSHSLFLAA